MALAFGRMDDAPAVGTAMQKMKELAEQLYNSTPALAEDMPVAQSKILGNEIRQKTSTVGSRILNFREPVAGSTKKENFSIAMSAEDWETKYREIWQNYEKEKQKAELTKTSMVKRQERYIARE